MATKVKVKAQTRTKKAAKVSVTKSTATSAAKVAARNATVKPAVQKKAASTKTTARATPVVAARTPAKKTATRAVEAKSPPKKLKDAGNKTVATKESVESFLKRVPREQLADTKTLIDMMRRATGAPAQMWGPSIIGFGHRTLTYESGRTMDWMVAAFSPRKQNLTVYVVDDSPECAALLSKLGKHSSSKVCLYIKRLSDINLDVLGQLIQLSVDKTRMLDQQKASN
jgi:hypothetical protein